MLNAKQKEAATFGNGALLILAGAGTGKTNTLAHRVAHLLLSGAAPERVLLLTFSRRAAQDMQRRAGRLLQQALGLNAPPQQGQAPRATQAPPGPGEQPSWTIERVTSDGLPRHPRPPRPAVAPAPGSDVA